MSTIVELHLCGIRSYSDASFQKIKFLQPLTLIWGKNGAGKTTIIESLRFIISGQAPPNSGGGKVFVSDPNMCNKAQVCGQIYLIFRSEKGVQIKAQKIVKATILRGNKKGLEFKSVDQSLAVKDDEGKEHKINHHCAVMQKQIPDLMGVSKQIIEKIVFCHQEQALWPFSQNANLKSIFDELFDTGQLVKLSQAISDNIKGLVKQVKQIKRLYEQQKAFVQEKLIYRRNNNLKVQEICDTKAQIKQLCVQLGIQRSSPQLQFFEVGGIGHLDHLYNKLRQIDAKLAPLGDSSCDIKFLDWTLQRMQKQSQTRLERLERLSKERAQAVLKIDEKRRFEMLIESKNKDFLDLVAQFQKWYNIKLQHSHTRNIQILSERLKGINNQLSQLPYIKSQLVLIAEIRQSRTLLDQIKSLQRNGNINLSQQYQYLIETLRQGLVLCLQLQNLLKTATPVLQTSDFGMDIAEAQKVLHSEQQARNAQLSQIVDRQIFRYVHIDMQRQIVQFVKQKRKCAYCLKPADPSQFQSKIKSKIQKSQLQLRQLQAINNSPHINQFELLKAYAVTYFDRALKQSKRFHLTGNELAKIKAQVCKFRLILQQSDVSMEEEDTEEVCQKHRAQDLQKLNYQLEKQLHMLKKLKDRQQQFQTRRAQIERFLREEPQRVNTADQTALQARVRYLQQQVNLKHFQFSLRSYKEKVSELQQLLSCEKGSVREDLPQLIDRELLKINQELDELSRCIKIKRAGQNNQKLLRLKFKYEEEISRIKEADVLEQAKKQTLLKKQNELRKLSDRLGYLQKDLSELSLNENLSKLVQFIVQIQCKESLQEDLQKQLRVLQNSLLKFHQEKMEQVNKIIMDIWRDVYTGQDIKKIQIKSEEDPSSRKNYQYRLVFQSHSGREIEMRGRCSMGQKVLASLVVRMALAEAFGRSCGIFTLDEPTTNLDRANIQRLGRQLNRLIQSRREQSNFQLIVITHDKQFVRLLSKNTDSCYKIQKDEEGFSKIQKDSIDDLL